MSSIPTYMGVDCNIFRSTENEIVQKYASKKVIIHTTDWTPLKQTIWLIDQFYLIQSQYPSVILLITETKSNHRLKKYALDKIQKKSIKNIEFLGTLSTALLPKYCSASDIVVYPGFGTSITTSLFVLQCMACETPAVISSDASEDVEHGKNGFVFQNNNEKEFQKYVLDILKDDELRLNLGKQSREYILKKHSWKNVAKIFEIHCLEQLPRSKE